METVNPILENPLLLAAILLFLAILPRALRQKKKSALDKAVERFEKEEIKAAAKGASTEDASKPEKPIALKDGSLVYRKKDQPDSQKTTDVFGGIPPFSSEDDDDEKVKIVKPGVPISHYETADPPPRKKIKLIKQEFSIAPDPNKVSSKKAPTDPPKVKPSSLPTDTQKSATTEDFPIPPISDNEESKDNWIEAEIPGLTIEPPAAEKPEDIPVFNAFPKKKYLTETENPQEPLPEEKQGTVVKNIAPKTEEKKDSKQEKPVAIEANSPEMEREILESGPKEVEINAPVVSHRNITLKEDESPETKAATSKTEETENSGIEAKPVPLQQGDMEASSETEKLKPFLLDLRYLDSEELETANSISNEKLPADMVDATIARLNALQVDLESQFTSTPGESISEEIPVGKDMRKDRTQNSLPEFEGIANQSSDKNEVTLEELDSFLFTATQRKKRE